MIVAHNLKEIWQAFNSYFAVMYLADIISLH